MTDWIGTSRLSSTMIRAWRGNGSDCPKCSRPPPTKTTVRDKTAIIPDRLRTQPLFISMFSCSSGWDDIEPISWRDVVEMVCSRPGRVARCALLAVRGFDCLLDVTTTCMESVELRSGGGRRLLPPRGCCKCVLIEANKNTLVRCMVDRRCDRSGYTLRFAASRCDFCQL